MTRNVVLAMLLSPLVSGCFSYVPVEPGQLSVDDRVRARVTETEARRLEEWVGVNRPVLSGVVVARRPDTLALRVPVESPAPVSGPRLVQDVRVAEQEIRTLERRVLARGRTAALTIGTAALMGYILYEALARPDPPGVPGTDPPPVNELMAGGGGGIRLTLPLR